MASNQSQASQQLLSQNIQNNVPSTAVPNSAGLTSAMPPVGGMSRGNVAPTAVGNSMGQAVPSNMYANFQRQIQGRQQQVVPQDQQQLHQHLMKQKFQQNLLQPNQLQSSQQPVTQTSLRQASASSTLQNQPTSLQQSTQSSMLQHQPQSVLRKQQQQQSSIMHQQLGGQQPNTPNMQQNQLIGQQNNMLDAQQRMMGQQNSISNMQQQPTIGQQSNLPNMHQQQSAGQQNNLPNMHQQQLGTQTNLSGFQQQQMVGIQYGNSGLQANQQPVHMLQQSKVAVQQQMQQNMANMMPNQGQQSQSQPMQQHLMSQMQPHPGQLQQQMGLQQQPNSLRRDMQQRIQTSGPMLQQQTAFDQKQLLQPQRVMPEMPLNSASQTGNASGGDWQEELYQKIKSMHEMYYPYLNEMYQRMATKLQQRDTLPQQPNNEQLEKLKFLKVTLERLILFLRMNKNDIQPHHKEKIVGVEKRIINMLNPNRPRKPVSLMQQGQLTQPHMHAMQQPQISQMHRNEGHMNPQMQPMNAQGSMVATQQNSLTNMQHNFLSSVSSVSNPRQNMLDTLLSGSNVVPGQGNALNQMQQVAMNSLQQNPVSGSQQMNINTMSSQNGLTTLQSNVNPLSNSNILLPQQIKHEQQVFSIQHIKQQYQRHQMQQQYMHRQQLIQQQQQQQQQTAPQQSRQLPPQQMMQLNQMNDVNDVKMRHQMSGKSGVLPQHNSSCQQPSYHHQQMKPGTAFSISSQLVLQAASPQIGHHPSPQTDQQNLLTTHTKVGTPLRSASSPFMTPSPSASMAPSPMPGDSEKINSGVSSLTNAGNSIHHLTNTAESVPTQSLAIGTPGISASPLLAKFSSPDGAHGVVSTIASGNSKVVERPLERLIKVVKSMSPKALSASMSDISSVVRMVDRIAGSAPGYGSRAVVGGDLVALTKCRFQAKNFFTQDGHSGTKRMRRYTSAMPSNVVSSTGSVNDSLRHLSGNESDGESTGASTSKRPRIEANHTLEEELREINQRLIDTVMYITDDDVDPTAAAAAAKGGEGTILKCSFNIVALSPNLNSQHASALMSPIQPLRLLIPKNYPNCSPILLDKFPVELSKVYEDLTLKVKSRSSISLRTLAQLMSLGEIASTWDNRARTVISEHAQQSGGGTFSSKYGTWENCLTAT